MGVAVAFAGRLMFMGALQLPSVITLVEPMKVCPWPLPEEWHITLSKNSRRNIVFEAASKLP